MKTVSNTEWVAARQAGKPSAQQQRILEVWQRLRGPFALPRWSAHAHEWETYDSGCAACLLCGGPHFCSATACDLVVCEDGSQVCPVTAYTVPSVRVCEVEAYSDCHAVPSPAGAGQGRQRAAATLPGFVHTCVSEVLCGARTRHALEREHAQMLLRRQQWLLRACRRAKRASAPPGACNMISVAEAVAWQAQHAREPQILDEQALRPVVEQCAAAITGLFHMTAVKDKGYTDSRMRHMVVGLLYLMRQGITFNETLLLPRVAVLGDILPLESSILSLFDVRAKIITETENTVKMMLREIPRHAILQWGKQQYGV